MEKKRSLKPWVKPVFTIVTIFLAFIILFNVVKSIFSESGEIKSTYSTQLQMNPYYDLNLSSNDVAGYQLINVGSGEILAQKNENKKLNPASITKLITNYILWDYIKSGKLSINSKVVSDENYKIIRKSNDLKSNFNLDKLNLEQLSYLSLFRSANDATTLIASTIAGSEKKFIPIMNSYLDKVFKVNKNQYEIYTTNGLTINDLVESGLSKSNLKDLPKDNKLGQNKLSVDAISKILSKIVNEKSKLYKILTSKDFKMDKRNIESSWYLHSSQTKNLIGGKSGSHPDAGVNGDWGYSFAGIYKVNNNLFTLVSLDSSNKGNEYNFQKELITNLKSTYYDASNSVNKILDSINKKFKTFKIVVKSIKKVKSFAINRAKLVIKFKTTKLNKNTIEQKIGNIIVNNENIGVLKLEKK